MKFFILVALACALVAVSECQDMTSLMLNAMGVEMPPMPPQVPESLRRHLYGPQRVKQQQMASQNRMQVMMAQRRQALLQQQQQQKANPYSTTYQASLRQPQQVNSVYSPANRIVQPGSPRPGGSNLAGAKVNPYSRYRVTSPRAQYLQRNPYSTSRAAGSMLPSVRQNAQRMTAGQGGNQLKMMSAFRKAQQTPKKIREAKAAGCKLPVDSTYASILMFNTCRSTMAQAICRAELMQCNNVGVSAMCCPIGMNRLAMDTISYMNKMQRFVSEIA